MENKVIELVKITAADIKELQELSKQTFLETFAASNTKEDMQHYLDTNFTDEKLSDEINNPHSECYVASIDNMAIGYLKINFGQAQTELQDNQALEIERIYVLQEFHGRKVGQLLFYKALQVAKESRLDYLWLGVWEKNTRALKFYEKNGFIPFGSHIFKLGHDEQTDIMMKLVLKN